MTREEFVMWMDAHDCYPEPFEPINGSYSYGIYYVNRNDNNRWIVMVTPINDRTLPDRDIRDFCDKLLIPYPDSVVVK